MSAEKSVTDTDVTTDFVAQQMANQSGAAEAEGVDAQQRDAFIRRAMAESRRMSAETAKSEATRREMYVETGQTRESMAVLTREHIAQVAAAQEAVAGAPGGRCGAQRLLRECSHSLSDCPLRGQ